MKVNEVNVSYGKKYSCGEYASKFVNPNMKVSIEVKAHGVKMAFNKKPSRSTTPSI